MGLISLFRCLHMPYRCLPARMHGMRQTLTNDSMHVACGCPVTCRWLRRVDVSDCSCSRRGDPDTCCRCSASHIAWPQHAALLYWPGGLDGIYNLPEVSFLSAPGPVTICPLALRCKHHLPWRLRCMCLIMRVRTVQPSPKHVSACPRACERIHNAPQHQDSRCITRRYLNRS